MQPQLDLTDRASLIGSLPRGGAVAEVGVCSGGFSQVILERNRPSRLVLIDCWEHQTGTAYSQDPANGPNQAYHDGMYAEVLRKFGNRPEVEIVRAYSVPAAGRFPDGCFDLVYLDGNHMIVDQDIAAYWPKVRSGGWLAGHDYCNVGDVITVKTAVDAWAASKGLRVFVAGQSSPNVFERNYPTWAVQKP
jgi:hypothetical protein